MVRRLHRRRQAPRRASRDGDGSLWTVSGRGVVRRRVASAIAVRHSSWRGASPGGTVSEAGLERAKWSDGICTTMRLPLNRRSAEAEHAAQRRVNRWHNRVNIAICFGNSTFIYTPCGWGVRVVMVTTHTPAMCMVVACVAMRPCRRCEPLLHGHFHTRGRRSHPAYRALPNEPHHPHDSHISPTQPHMHGECKRGPAISFRRSRLVWCSQPEVTQQPI